MNEPQVWLWPLTAASISFWGSSVTDIHSHRFLFSMIRRLWADPCSVWSSTRLICTKSPLYSEAEWAEKEACACIYIFALYAWAECTFCNFSGYSGFTLQCKQNANITKISVSGWVAMLSLAARSDGAQCFDTLWSHFWTAQKKIHSYMATTRLHIFHLNNLYTYCSMTLLTCNGGHIYHLFNEERMCSQGG